MATDRYDEMPSGNSGHQSLQSSVLKDYQRQFREPSATQPKKRGAAKSVDFGHRGVSAMQKSIQEAIEEDERLQASQRLIQMGEESNAPSLQPPPSYRRDRPEFNRP